jgi:hypothetical protein
MANGISPSVVSPYEEIAGGILVCLMDPNLSLMAVFT